MGAKRFCDSFFIRVIRVICGQKFSGECTLRKLLPNTTDHMTKLREQPAGGRRDKLGFGGSIVMTRSARVGEDQKTWRFQSVLK